MRWLLLTVALIAAGPLRAAQTILVWGDSLSAGYGVDSQRGWVRLLEQKLGTQADASLRGWTVVNGSVSGETTAGGLSRLPAALARHRPALVLIELGGNDGLRGLSLKAMRANLETMIVLARKAGATPLLFEMRIPSNYGQLMTERFQKAFAEVAEATRTPLVPFFLAPVADDRPKWFQDDGIHPNTAAQPLLLDAVWPQLVPVLRAPAASRAAAAP
ncbi:MAG: arylesterase [Gammaproteobacteria bacterium]|nr:arylesterase [Gammaproteobacteria bacterium]